MAQAPESTGHRLGSSADNNSYNGFREGDYAIRKEKACRIKKIYFDINGPPMVDVEMIDEGNIVSTEFHKLRKPRPGEIPPEPAKPVPASTAESESSSKPIESEVLRARVPNRKRKRNIAFADDDADATSLGIDNFDSLSSTHLSKRQRLISSQPNVVDTDSTIHTNSNTDTNTDSDITTDNNHSTMIDDNSTAWQCTACTFINQNVVSQTCDICKTRRDSNAVEIFDDAPPQSQNAPTDEPSPKPKVIGWTCHICTYNNIDNPNGTNCIICQSQRTSTDVLLYNEQPPMSNPETTVARARPAAAPAKDWAPTKEIRFISYNVWFNEELCLRERIGAIGRLIEKNNADVVALQEVTPTILTIIRKSHWYRRGKWIDSVDKLQQSNPYFVALLTRHKFVGEPQLMPFSNSKMMRYLLQCTVMIGDRLVTFATSHLESPVGPYSGGQKDLFTPQRQEQLKKSLNFLNNFDNVIFGGDMNWIDPSKNKTNDGLMQLPYNWNDAWKLLRPNEKGHTYDSRANKMLRGYLSNRLDRVLFKSKDFKLSSIEMIGTKPIDEKHITYEKKVSKRGVKGVEILPVLPSDHFGLLSVFKVIS